MRTITIVRFAATEDKSFFGERGCQDVTLVCEDFKDLDRYIKVAQRMRPDRIVIEYDQYSWSKDWKEKLC